MNWIKKGMLYVPDGSREWANSHAMFPVFLPGNGTSGKIYVSPRDINGRSSILSLDVEIKNGDIHIKEISDRPVLSPGQVGAFDDNGVTINCFLKNTKNNLLLYYIGWNAMVKISFHASIGIASSDDGGASFQRVFDGPILERNALDPYVLGGCSILADEGKFKMWYGSGTKWDEQRNTYHAHIRYAYSNDGIDWIREGQVCIDFANEYEYYITRPSVLLDKGAFRMWYCYRASKKAEAYRIGYAESNDGLSWIRKDDAVGIDVSPQGWDSEMICYPYVFRHDGLTYMLYNGNGYGRSGFGYAVLEE